MHLYEISRYQKEGIVETQAVKLYKTSTKFSPLLRKSEESQKELQKEQQQSIRAEKDAEKVMKNSNIIVKFFQFIVKLIKIIKGE